MRSFPIKVNNWDLGTNRVIFGLPIADKGILQNTFSSCSRASGLNFAIFKCRDGLSLLLTLSSILQSPYFENALSRSLKVVLRETFPTNKLIAFCKSENVLIFANYFGFEIKSSDSREIPKILTLVKMYQSNFQ